MRIHLIAIGGAAMHNLAIALKKNGHQVTGSDDEIFEPSLSRLKNHGLLPSSMGWNTDHISSELDLVILGMHARKDNIELISAQQKGIQIMSYPEFIYDRSKDKKRVVIAGSHGKTSTTSMLLHVLKKLNHRFDFMVGAQIEGFDTMVQLSDAPLIILEGDEYFSSPIDMKAKFLWYRPHIAMITGIAWDHINVYPSLKLYHQAFEDLILSMEKEGSLVYFDKDEVLNEIAEKHRSEVKCLPYIEADHVIRNGKTYLLGEGGEYELSVFGRHNLQNIQGARLIALELGISEKDFNMAISEFTGASNRLELIRDTEELKVFRDFAHSPSKLKATVNACREQFPDRSLLAVMELHTFSSLNADFLSEYKSCMDDADTAIVYFNPDTIKHKKLPDIHPEDVIQSFGRPDLLVFTDKDELKEKVVKLKADHQVLLVMSSGNFGGLGMGELLS